MCEHTLCCRPGLSAMLITPTKFRVVSARLPAQTRFLRSQVRYCATVLEIRRRPSTSPRYTHRCTPRYGALLRCARGAGPNRTGCRPTRWLGAAGPLPRTAAGRQVPRRFARRSTPLQGRRGVRHVRGPPPAAAQLLRVVGGPLHDSPQAPTTALQRRHVLPAVAEQCVLGVRHAVALAHGGLARALPARAAHALARPL